MKLMPHNWAVMMRYLSFLILLIPAFLVGCPAQDDSGPAPEDLNVILVIVDTLGAQHLEFMGYERQTSPFVDEFSERCIIFDRAYAPKPSTLPSFTSLFSGLHPVTHNIQRNGVEVPEDIHRLIEDFSSAGFRTVGFAAGGTMAARYGIARGFETYFDCLVHDIPAPQIVEKVEGFLEGSGALGRPTYDSENDRLFMFVHFYDPHTDYTPDPEILAQFADPFYSGPMDGTLDVIGRFNKYELEFDEADLRHTADLYDAEILTLDDHLRELIDIFDRTGLMDNSVIVFSSDHGENLGEHHYITHGHPYETALHIPLMVHFPDEHGAGTRVGSLVEFTDILPTLMEMLKLPVPEGLDSFSFLHLLEDPGGASDDDGRAFVLACGGFNDNQDRTYGLFDGRYRYIQDIRWSDEPLLYDITIDPREENDIAADHPDLLELYGAVVDYLSVEAGPIVEPEYDEETEEMLRSLGYLH